MDLAENDKDNEDGKEENEEDEEKKINEFEETANTFFNRVPKLRAFFIISKHMIEEKFQLSKQTKRKGF